MLKRGEITTQQIVIIIILIVSFAVLLFFIFRLELGKVTEEEICRNSVVTRGSSILPSESIPLNCHRNYVCVTEDESCEQMTNPEIKKIKNKEEIYNVLAEEMTDCWWMFGEGKINYVGEDFVSDLYCSICSQIAFDDSIEKKIGAGEFDKKEFYNYLANEKIPGKDITYFEYLYKGKVGIAPGAKFEKINLKSQYYAMMGIKSHVSGRGWIAGGASAGILAVGAAAGIFLTAPLSVPAITAVIVVGGTAGGVAGNYVATIVEGSSGNEYLSPSIIEVNSEEFRALECYDITTLA